MKIQDIINDINSGRVNDSFFESSGKPEQIQDIHRLEQSVGIELPHDYKLMLSTYGACEVGGPDTNIIFIPIMEMLDNKISPVSNLGNVLVFATDNGGNYYFYDIEGIGGHGRLSIYDVYPGNPDWNYCTFLASDLTTLIDKISKGESFV